MQWLCTEGPICCRDHVDLCLCVWQILHAFERWHAQHSVLVTALLEVRNQGSMVGPLAERIMSVVSHLSDFFRLKAAVVCPVLASINVTGCRKPVLRSGMPRCGLWKAAAK